MTAEMSSTLLTAKDPFGLRALGAINSFRRCCEWLREPRDPIELE